MSEPIDIVVTDKIAPTVQNKFLNIAQAALEAANNVDKVQSALAKITGGNLGALASAQEKIASSVDKAALSYLKQETALNKAIEAESRAQAATAKLEQQNTSAAIAAEKLAVAQSNAANAASKVAAAAQSQTASAIEQARASQIAANAQAEYNRILGVNQTVQNSAKASAAAFAEQLGAQEKAIAALAAAAKQSAGAVNAFGETEAQVAARLRAVAEAGAKLSQQQNTVTASANVTSTSQQKLAAATTASGTAAAGAATRYTNYMSALNTIGQSNAPNVIQQTNAALQQSANATNQAAQATASNSRSVLFGIIQYRLITEALQAFSNAIRNYFQLAADYQNLQNKLLQVTVSQTELNSLTLELLNVANRARAPLEAVGTTFQRINNAIKAVGGSQKEALQITEALTKATAAAGLTTSEQASALLQVSQAFNKGKLDGDEFRSVMENFPQFADAIAKSLGLANKGLLFEAAKEGKITLDVMRDAMLKLGEAADQNLARSTQTVEQAFTNLKNSSTVLIGELDKALGITALLTRGLNFLAEAARNAANQNAAAGTAAANAIQQSNLDTINKQVEAQKALIESGNAGQAGQVKLNNLLKIQANLQTNIQENARASIKTIRELDNAAELNDAAGKQGAFASSLSAVNKEMDSLKVGTHKADTELASYRKNLGELEKAAKNLGTPEALKAYQNAKNLQAQAEAAIIKKDTAKVATPKATLEENRAVVLAKITGEIDKQLVATDQLNDARSVAQKLDEIDNKLANNSKGGRLAPLQALTAAERESITTKLELAQAAKRVEAAQESIYNNTNQAAIRNLNAGEQAVTNLLKNHAITASQAAEAQRALVFQFQSATDPLFAFNRGMADQNALLGLNSREQEQVKAVQAIANQIAAQGKQLTDEQTKSIKEQTAAYQHKAEVAAAVTQIESQGVEASRQLQIQQQATQEAYAKGSITLDDYTRRMVNLAIETANLNLSRGIGTYEDAVLASLGRILEGYKGVAAGATDIFGNFFSSFTDGFANSVGRAIVYSENLGDALHQVAQSALSELIGALVKLGIQYVINAALGQTVAASATAANAALGAATAVAWAPAAALVSLASFGANAIPADAALLSTVALSDSLALLSGFEAGGYTGNVGTSTIAGVVHGQEFVSNAEATRLNRPALEAMNRGATLSASAAPVIEINNYGTPQTYQVDQMSEGRIRIIAQDVVRKDAPKVVATDMNNPNGVTSKAVGNSFNTTRKRP